ncbi:hypothetical protein M0C34_16130 [Agarivorans sp. TSD2052]|uniref:hypothetical protein n=1 Tax=Agarivorans sp. TSD2052 TaxID=2937286 RepID=UPI00200EB2C1|nr:hypothetical protein [Agarivorans sp. TSD2052]UPW17748.1 hypothetical protein M0C34_16130 [Agarivorans sp. TSD2052]
MNIERLTECLQLSTEQIEKFIHLETEYSFMMDQLFSFDGDRKHMWKAMRDLMKEKDGEIIKLLSNSQIESYLSFKSAQQQQRKRGS